jgi:hypothetical protein
MLGHVVHGVVAVEALQLTQAHHPSRMLVGFVLDLKTTANPVLTGLQHPSGAQINPRSN